MEHGAEIFQGQYYSVTIGDVTLIYNVVYGQLWFECHNGSNNVSIDRGNVFIYTPDGGMIVLHTMYTSATTFRNSHQDLVLQEHFFKQADFINLLPTTKPVNSSELHRPLIAES